MTDNVEQTTVKARLRQYNIKSLLDRAAGAVGRIYPYYLLTFKQAGITCSATDSLLTIVAETVTREGEEVSTSGIVCVPAKKISELIEAFGDSFLDFTLIGKRLQVECGNYTGNIPCVDPAEHFPPVNMPEASADFACDGDLLSGIYAACSHSLAKAGKNYLMEGVHLRTGGGTLVGVACDGTRLSLAARGDLADGWDILGNGITVSGRAFAELKRINAGTLQMWFTENFLTVSGPGITLITRLLDGEYCAYRRVIPTDHPHCLVVNAAELAKIVERVNILSESDSVVLDIKASESGDSGDIRITAENTAGESSDLVIAEVQGEPLQIRVAPRQLVEALRALAHDSEYVLIKYGTDQQGLVLLPCDHSSWDERLELVMPRKR